MRIDSRLRIAAVCVLVAIGCILRVHLALTDDGIFWPDEIYQSLEPAHRWLFGYGIIPPEFYLGARNWAFPGLCAGILRVCAWLGGDNPRHYMPLVRCAFSMLSMLGILGAYRLARALGATMTGASLSAILLALAPPAIYFAPRALSDTTSATLIVWGFALALSRERVRFISGVSLIGLAVLFRMQNGMFALGLLAMLWSQRRMREVGTALWVLAAWAMAYGALDRITWGGWFHSAFAYFQLAEKASAWGTEPFTCYFHTFATAMPLITLMALPLALIAASRAPALLAIVLVSVLALSVVGHKEFRYVYPMVPLWFALAGLGFSALRVREWGVVPFAALALVSGLRFRSLTFPELGLYTDKPAVSAFDGFGDVNRLLFAAHDRADLCGIQIVAARVAWSGGATYLHRNVPIYARDEHADGHFNYVIAVGGAAGEIVARDGNTALVKVADRCTPDANYNWAIR